MFFAKNKTQGWCTARGEQRARGPYIMLFQHKWDLGKEKMPRELRVLVRSVKLYQFGHFMTGTCFVKLPREDTVVRVCLSGSFGRDGLPIDVARECEPPDEPDGPPARLWPLLHPLPEELQEVYWKYNPHNRIGTYKPIREWAREHYRALRLFYAPFYAPKEVATT